MGEMSSERAIDRASPRSDGAVAELSSFGDMAALNRALFDTNPDLVWEIDVDGTVRRVNARIVDVLGYSPDEVAGRPLRDFSLDGDSATENALRLALTGQPNVCVCRMRHREGHAVLMRATVMPLLIDDVVVGVYANAQDVTAATLAEQKLREGEALYRVLVEQMPECVAIFVDGRCEFINPAGAAMRGPGFTPADVEHHRWTDYVDPADDALYAATLAEVASAPEGTSRTFEVRYLWPDGRRVEVEGQAVAVRLNGRPAVHLFARDVTARRRVDTERLGAQRMEALGRLAAGVAHDFNNLLAVMLLAVESAATAIPQDDPLREELADAAEAARRGRALTRQLLTFARRQESTPTTVAVNEVVENMAVLLRRIAGQQVQLAFALDPDAGAVTVDPGQMEQALLNLVTNARDALPSGGEVAIDTAAVDGDVRLTVRDSGVGIPLDVRPHLFEPFYTTKREGYGLGLATVYGVVTGAGGRIEVESEPNRGTTFHLYFPRAAEELPRGQEPPRRAID